MSVLATGALADSSDKARLMSAGSFLLAISFFFYYLWPPYALNLVIMLFLGAGIGAYEGVADAMLLGIHERRQGLHISINHFFVTFGALGITLYLIFLAAGLAAVHGAVRGRGARPGGALPRLPGGPGGSGRARRCASGCNS